MFKATLIGGPKAGDIIDLNEPVPWLDFIEPMPFDSTYYTACGIGIDEPRKISRYHYIGKGCYKYDDA